MHLPAILVLAASAVNAHYTFPSLGSTGDWAAVRKTKNWQNNGPVTDVTSSDMRCYELSPGTPAAQTVTVAAGSTVIVNANPSAYHPGPLQVYLAKVPSGQTLASFDGSGPVWFRIYAEQPKFGSQLTWPSTGRSSFPITIPKCIPPGDYLIRSEHIGLHVAQGSGGAQFYISCGQLTVTGGGSTSPSNLVAFPGAYKAADPGILININYPVPTRYVNPGPPTFSC